MPSKTPNSVPVSSVTGTIGLGRRATTTLAAAAAAAAGVGAAAAAAAAAATITAVLGAGAAFRTFLPSFFETGFAFGRSLIAVFWLTSLLAVIGCDTVVGGDATAIPLVVGTLGEIGAIVAVP